ncbi:dihydrolipoamide acetyltransferase family protein [Angustibacter sp. Root456]|uniref:dihydrolipoamide acetyltransferase family protein n=1 Tax=Angustibacter sp. Root456 TaxID=1736539 RepID=UPI00070224D3|nr:dihydrolipoamide acetyltransferase family protein [Angustibacter sp. Root456]KQX61928.1 hypothetical protein ASD06_15400 [Angustibacter sp. Root456]
MSTLFTMPALGADMESGTLLEWLVAPGDEVHRGQVIAVVDTAKSAIDVESWHDGVVERLLVEPGTTVDVGTPLAELGAVGQAIPVASAVIPSPRVAEPRASVKAPPPATPVVRHLAAQLGVDLGSVVGTGQGGRITHADVRAAAGPPITPTAPRRARVSPVARRRAAQLGIDVGTLNGTGSGGAVTLADVEVAASAPATAPAPAVAPQPVPAKATSAPPDDTATRNAAMRAAIGQLMSRSKREIPHYYLAHTIELSAALRWLKDHNTGLSVAQRVLPAAVLLRATAVAATRVPEVNGHFVDGAFEPSTAVHLGVAVNLRGGGLVTPALHAADQLDVDSLMAALQDLVMRARAGHLKRTELSEGTITVTSLGERGVELVHGVIVPPQVALVGIGTVVERPWAVGDAVAVRPVVTVTVSGDHRAGDGHLGARFLVTLDELLQRPEDL